MEVGGRIARKLGCVVSCDARVIDKQLDAVRLLAGDFIHKFLDLFLLTDISRDTRAA